MQILFYFVYEIKITANQDRMNLNFGYLYEVKTEARFPVRTDNILHLQPDLARLADGNLWNDDSEPVAVLLPFNKEVLAP